MMNNNEIADHFSLLAKLMDIHGENSFKSKSYAAASFNIEKLTVQLYEIEKQKIETLKGIGASSAKKIIELLETGQLTPLNEMVEKTPKGVIEMLKIKGIGPKKINTIWKEMELESVGELLYACKENRLKLYKGFGEKTQVSVIASIEFYLKNMHSFLYAQTILAAAEFKNLLQNIFSIDTVFITGDFARQIEIINSLDFVIAADKNLILEKINIENGFTFTEETADYFFYETEAGIKVKLYPAKENAIEKLIETTSSPLFFAALNKNYTGHEIAKNEVDYFSIRKFPFIPSFLREDAEILNGNGDFSNLIQNESIKGLIHCHSSWSDGNNTIAEMAKAAMENGMEYMVISDHSKTASYAQGLREEQIREQHKQIDELNEQLAPFKIFKSIESDILGDGSLDYSNAVLATFDLVIASVHSNLKMTEEKAMARVMAAIENPYTTILGHPTGRLLLSRPGYPLDFKKVIDACAANDVVIELNAHPSRLDIDWREIKYALQKNILISIDPDAHSLAGIKDTIYGVYAAQKANVQTNQNLSSFSLVEFEQFLLDRKKKVGHRF